MARIKGRDIYLDYDDQIYFGDSQEAAMWMSSNGELQLNYTLSGIAATAPYHLVMKQDVEFMIASSISGGGTIYHNELLNLDSDDHLQYVPISGSRGFIATVSGIDPTESYHLATKNYVDQVAAGYPVYYVEINIHIQVPKWGQYVIHDTGYLEVAGTLEFGEGGMLIIQGVI